MKPYQNRRRNHGIVVRESTENILEVTVLSALSRGINLAAHARAQEKRTQASILIFVRPQEK